MSARQRRIDALRRRLGVEPDFEVRLALADELRTLSAEEAEARGEAPAPASGPTPAPRRRHVVPAAPPPSR